MHRKRIIKVIGFAFSAVLLVTAPRGTYAGPQESEATSTPGAALDDANADVGLETPNPETPNPETPSDEENEGAATPEEPEKEDTEVEVEDSQKAEEAEEAEEVEKKRIEDEALALSRIQAGTRFYTENLKEQYGISLSKDFGEVLLKIESKYIEQNEIKEVREGEDKTEIKAENWQDVLAVYLFRQWKNGTTDFELSKKDQKGLAEVFAEMNALVPTKSDASQTTIIYKNLNSKEIKYENLHVEDLIARDTALAKPILTEEDKTFLNQYSSVDCMILCASATGASGFINQSLDGENEARFGVVEAAYSLVGKIPYFWGGKSSSIGWDDRWGKATMVSAAGSRSSGSIQKYGLDCSGYVSWAFLNGTKNSQLNISQVGAGTSGQWALSEAVSQEDARAGDLVFLSAPTNASKEHVGIVVGKSEEGELIVAHCNATDNGVVVQSAYSAGFRYVRRPNCLKAADEQDTN